MKEWIDNVKMNDVTRDANTNEFILVTNGICIYDHSDTTAFKEGHKVNDGHCCYEPWEGIVFQTEDMTVKGWSMLEIKGRKLQPVDPATAKSIMDQMTQIMEDNRRKEKAKNFKSRRNKEKHNG
jgi:hypothetical protein